MEHIKKITFLETIIHISSTIFVHSTTFKVKLATIVEGDPKAPFSIATTLFGVGDGATPFPGLLWPGTPGFNLRSSHTKDSKNGT